IDVLHGVVAAVVAQTHLDGLCAAGQRQNLASQTDAENGDIAGEEFPGRLDGVVAGLGVSRAIGQEDAVRIQGQRLRSSSLRGHYRDATVTLRQHAQDVAFYAEVISHYVEGLLMLQHRMTFAPLPQPLIPLVSL